MDRVSVSQKFLTERHSTTELESSQGFKPELSRREFPLIRKMRIRT